MKKILLFFLILVVVIIYGKGSFVDANTTIPKEQGFSNEKQIIEQLFQQRAQLWNKLYEKNNKPSQYINQLKDIVAEPLLAFDIQAFQDVQEFPTDIDKVLDVHILKINHVVYKRSEMTAKVKMYWKMQGLSSQYQEEIDYIVTLKRQNNKWKICDYNIEQ
ncbi:hypothetical protein QBE52_08350 [Clostridiaceae bacterium 35-E11]